MISANRGYFISIVLLSDYERVIRAIEKIEGISLDEFLPEGLAKIEVYNNKLHYVVVLKNDEGDELGRFSKSSHIDNSKRFLRIRRIIINALSSMYEFDESLEFAKLLEFYASK